VGALRQIAFSRAVYYCDKTGRYTLMYGGQFM